MRPNINPSDEIPTAEMVISNINDVHVFPWDALTGLTKYQFIKNPTEDQSNDDPPKIVADKAEIIPIDEFLGLYRPLEHKITIFNKGIEAASNIIKCNSDDLRYVVRLHEWAHALIHLGSEDDVASKARTDNDYMQDCIKQADRIYDSIEKRLHEQLAQLLTYHSLKMLSKNAKGDRGKEINSERIRVFKELNKRQPMEYIVDKYLDMSHERFIESIRFIKKDWLKGTFEPWDRIMRLS